MKHNMNRVLSIVALLMLTIGTWAQTADDVTVNVKPNANAGTVTKAVDDKGVCTLTVTPAEGYCLTVENLTAVATLKGGAVQAPRRNLPVDNGELTITPDEGNADPAGVTKYTFEIEDGWSVEVTAEFQVNSNTFSVCGVAVTEANSDDILNDGKVSYDALSNTLTLNGATLYPYNDWCVQVGEGLSYLNVKLLGNNTMRGNAFKFATSKPALVFKSDPITPGSLLIGPFTEGETKYSLISPDGQNTQVFYEDNLAKEETDQSIMIGGAAINLKIGGITVTSQNTDDILSDGKVSFNPLTNTLTLNGATIDMTGKEGFPIESNVNDLTVLLIGSNTFTTNTASAYGFKYTATSNTGKLTFTHEQNGFGSLTVSGGTLANGYTVAYDNTEDGWIVAENAIGYAENYLTIGDVAITSGNLSHTLGNGMASYNRLTQTLSLNNYVTEANITSNIAKLTILLTGENSVGTISYSGDTAGELTISKDNAGNQLLNELTVSGISNYAVTVEDPLVQTENVFSDVRRYNLWVNGDQVTSKNMSDVVLGVTFDGDHTLMFTNTDIDASNNGPFIVNGLSKLTIVLVGENTVNCGAQPFLTKKEGDNDHQVVFTLNDMETYGGLSIQMENPENWCTGHEVTCLSKLKQTADGSKVIIHAETTTIYALTIGTAQVTNKNAGNVSVDGGSVMFDATYNVLTLNNANIAGNITSGIETLVVNLMGANTMTGNFVKAEGGSELIFETTDTKSSLTMGAAIDGLTATYNSKLRLEGNTIAVPESYGIKIAGTPVTTDNRSSLCEGKVEYDNNATLILKGATINGQIVVDKASSIKDGVLTVYLKNSNVINVSTGEKAFKCNDGELEVQFVTDGTDPGKLEINYVDGVSEKVVLTYKDLVATTADNKITIKTALENVVDEDKPKADVDFKNGMNAGTNTNNQTINNVLVTMGDETGNKETTSGYDQTQNALVFVGAAAMTEKDLKEVLEEQPGTKAYADKFTGLTFALPAGSSILKITSYIADKNYAFFIQVDDQEPVMIESGVSNIQMGLATVSLALSKASVVKLFIMEKPKTTGAPQMDMANRRIGPKSSVAGGLGGISVQSHSVQSSDGPAQTYKSMEKKSMSKAISAVTNVRNGYSCSDPNITDLPNNMFLKENSSNAPSRRGAAVETILPDGLTFLDFSNTKITGMEVSRSEGAFNGVPENVFIYMPAGNTTKEKNVVIGGICDKLELDGSENAQPFKAMKNFKVGQAVLKREFAAGSDNSKATIYLPYAIPQEDADKLGTFYEYLGNDGTTVQMKMVNKGGLKANKPYIFQAKDVVKDPLVRVVDVVAIPAETEGFKGVYDRKDYEPGMYCYAAVARDGKNAVGEFVEMGPGSWVPPFRAYIIGNGGPSLAIAWDGEVDNVQNEDTPTAVETIKPVANKKVAEGWWTINGMRLNTQPTKAGLYVKDGKMVVVK